MNIKNCVFNAASDGKLDSLKILLFVKSKNEISEFISAFTNGATPLIVACQNGHLEIVKYLIQKCYADVEEVGMVIVDDETVEGASPLWCAAAAGHLSIVKTLIKHKASINSAAREGSTPLRAACYKGHSGVIKCLIENGADTNIVNIQGQTCLMAACYNEHYAICNYLIHCGAKVDAQDIYGNSALKICVALRNVEMAKHFIELGVDVQIAGCYRELSKLIYPCTDRATSLLMACKDGQLEVVQYLIKKCNADIEEVGTVIVDGQTIEGASPLWCAACAGHLSIVKTLIEHKACINSTTHTKSTPLRAACFKGHFEIVEYLIMHEANINILNKDQSTCLMVALYNQQNKISKYLVECGAKMDTIDSEGFSPLLMCVLEGYLEMAKYLIDHGANIELADSHGQTCLIIACRSKCDEFSKYLLEHGANVNRKTLEGSTALHECAESNNLEMIKILFNKGAKIYEDSCGITPLMTAALNGNESVVDFFMNNYEITKDAKINAFKLLGAAKVDKTEDMTTALAYWKKAMVLQYEDNKFPIEKLPIYSPLASYLNTTEVYTINQLKNLNATNTMEIKKQSLLVRERILGDSHPDTIYYIRKMGAASEIRSCIQLWMYALEIQQQDQEPLSPKTNVIFRILTELFSQMIERFDIVIREGLIIFLFQSLLLVFQKTLNEIERASEIFKKENLKQLSSFSDIVIMALYHVGLMSMLLPYLNQSEKIQLKETVYKFVHLNLTITNGFTPLHLACVKHPTYQSNYPVISYPFLPIIDLLLEVGANPNTMNDDHNTPLHLAAMNIPCAVDVLKLLLNSGAHLDNRNLDNLTPLQIIRDIPSLHIYPLMHLNLQCLCAQAINTSNISYNGRVPKQIHEFLFSHCAH